jgi:nitrile hydratase
VGVIVLVHGAHVFPDSVVLGEGENPQWLYTVRFDSQELWGPDADRTVKISVDAFEPYLEAGDPRIPCGSTRTINTPA